MKRDYICPYCFNRHKMHEVQFACSDDSCLEDDQVYANHWGYHIMKRPTITDAPAPGKFSFLKPTMPSEMDCRACDKTTYSRVCPTCHSKLPTTISDYEDYIIAVIGAKQAGKSHYVAVLIDQIINEIGNAYHCYLKPEDDETMNRYNRQFRDPIYKHKTVLNVTKSAVTDPDVKKPLLYTLNFSGGLGNKVITLAFFDTAGEDLKAEDIMEKHTKYICNSAGVICLLDPLQLPEVRNQITQKNPHASLPTENNEADGLDILIRTTNLIRNTLRIKASKKIKIPLAVSFSKTDAIEPLLDPTSKLLQPSRHTHTNNFNVSDFQAVNDEMKALVQGWTRGNIPNLLEHHYQDYAYFGITALGHNPSGNMRINEVKPNRVEDPFLWLLWKNGIIKGIEGK